MKKLLIVISAFILVVASCNKKDNSIIPPTPPDSTIPDLSFPLTSTSTVTWFTPFGDSLHSLGLNKGYEFTISDTNEYLVAACSGIVTAVGSNGHGSNDVSVIFKRTSIYTFLYSGMRTTVVHVNDSLNPGTLLGKVASSGTFDFFVLKKDSLYLCPETISSASFDSSIQFVIRQHNMQHPTDSVFGACYVPTIRK